MDEGSRTGFLNRHPTFWPVEFDPDRWIPSILPRTFQAPPEDNISFPVRIGERHLACPIAEPFVESMMDKLAIWMLRPFLALGDNPVSNHILF
jgi:hypothetical protein